MKLLSNFKMINKTSINVHVQVLWGHKFSNHFGKYQEV